MATSGDSRPRLAGLAGLAGLAIVTASLLAGCVSTAATPAHQAASPTASSESRASGARAASLTALCAGQPAPAIASALTRTVPASGREELVPLGISADGGTGYVSAWTPSFSGVAAIDLRTGSLHPILAFADPASDQADGARGGRWLVWEQTYSLQSLDDFTVYAWDSVTGRLVRLGHSLRDPAGTAWPSPWHAPAVSTAYAAWAQGYGPGGLVQIRLADLRTGRVGVIAEGHVQAPFFDGNLLVWPSSARPGAPTTLHAYSLADHKAAPLPAVLRAVTGTDYVAADGTRTAYLSPGLTKLYYSQAPGQPARSLLTLPPHTGTEFTSLELGAGTLAWSTTRATFVANTSTGGYVQVTPAFGLAVTGQGPAVLVADAPTAKAAHPSLPLHVLGARAVSEIAAASPSPPATRSPGTGQTAPPCGQRQ